MKAPILVYRITIFTVFKTIQFLLVLDAIKYGPQFHHVNKIPDNPSEKYLKCFKVRYEIKWKDEFVSPFVFLILLTYMVCARLNLLLNLRKGLNFITRRRETDGAYFRCYEEYLR